MAAIMPRVIPVIGAATMRLKSGLKLRKVAFSLTGGVNDWNGDDLFRSHLFNALSVMLPGGEKFFLETARTLLPELGETQLAADCRGFITQEAVHSKQHRLYNDRLGVAGYGITGLERISTAQLAFAAAVLPKSWHAGMAAAFEHYTALISHAVLANPHWLEGARAGYRDLWTWHAIEEIEHKTVAFDIFNATGGSYGSRIITMMLATFGLVMNMCMFMVYFLIKDGAALRPSVWRSGFLFMFWRSGIFGNLLRLCLAYYMPRFHPSDHENGHLVENWEGDVPAASK